MKQVIYHPFLPLHYHYATILLALWEKIIKSESYHCCNAIVNFLTLGTWEKNISLTPPKWQFRPLAHGPISRVHNKEKRYRTAIAENVSGESHDL